MNAVIDFPRQHDSGARVGSVLRTFVRHSCTSAVDLKIESASWLGERQRIKSLSWFKRRKLERLVTRVLGSLADNQQKFLMVSEMAGQLADLVRDCEPATGEFVDPDLLIQDSSQSLCKVIDEFLPSLAESKASVDTDDELSTMQRERLHAGFDGLIEEVAVARRGVVTLIAAVEFHDEAAISPDELHLDAYELIAKVHGDDGVELLHQLHAAEGQPCFSLEASKDLRVAER